ncbi:3-deoxy-D-manno-octulosonic acid transferase [Stappia sp. BW2]|uniref:3-deoxy-D-manno-octulosonic acid transferase n=1 Tax=Stappia sp. BW2 TaxID=2592622 RepID=UPI0011DE8751|nr:3-deoxy-D-manno-octulosonic acid transferase [Stappia sp. BW2]TYC67688.1 3-deoxy-D-manno-octulosonic acid transferase [Stappia sp. BW2]
MADRRPLVFTLYRGLARALTPLFNLLFWFRSRSGKEVPTRKGERFGRTATGRPAGSLVWIHAASVGETMSVLPLVEDLTASGQQVLLTTVTVTAAELAQSRLPQGALHQFMPFDAPGPVSRFLDHWAPDLAMVVESEIWPCLFDEMRARQTPFVLLNGRLSDRSYRSWARFPRISGYLFRCLDLVLAQSAADGERFRLLGCGNVSTPGNLKYDAPEPAVDEDQAAALRAQTAGRPVWLAALTHPGEDEIVLEAHGRLCEEFPELLLILVPRHPARADDIAGLIENRGLRTARRSLEQAIETDTDVYLGDTLGEMGLFYRLAPVTFLGGSFNDAGGHNPVEAALSGSALVTGPRVANARAVYKDFWSRQASLKAELPENLAERIGSLLRDPEKARVQAETARALVEAGRGALVETLRVLQPMLGKTGPAPDNPLSRERA